jgi:hypothetical protein
VIHWAGNQREEFGWSGIDARIERIALKTGTRLAPAL